MQNYLTASTLLPTVGPAGIALGLNVTFNTLGHCHHLEKSIPEFITLRLVAEDFYLSAVYLIDSCRLVSLTDQTCTVTEVSVRVTAR
jgi:hypothetical protein